MGARPVCGPALMAGLALTVLGPGFPASLGLPSSASADSGPAPSAASPEPGPPVLRRAVRSPRWLRAGRPDIAPRRRESAPRRYLIHLLDGGEPIVVEDYVEEHGEIVFEKYGGAVRIPTYEIARIVPDSPNPVERTANLPSGPAVDPDSAAAPVRPESGLYLTMRGGGNLQVVGLAPEGEHVRVSLPDGSFTVPRSEITSVVRVPPGSETPEAWLSVLATDPDEPTSGLESELVPPAASPDLPYPASDRPHFVRLANGQLMRVETFWIEDGEFRFRRLGGIVGLAMNEVMRLFPEEIAPIRGRTPVRFVGRLAPDLLEVSVRSGHHRVRLVGVEPVDGTWTGESPWRHLEPGSIIYLEFDRQRYDADGNWLAYVFLPNGRMLNAELVRLGLARPAGDGRNARYLDLLHEMAGSGAAGSEHTAE